MKISTSGLCGTGGSASPAIKMTTITNGEKMNNKGQLIQDPFLNEIRREKIPVSIFLVNGIKLQGFVESFDQFVVLLKNNVCQQLVYKHAISTVVPTCPIHVFRNEEEPVGDEPI